MRITHLQALGGLIFQGLERLRPAWWFLLRVWIAVVFLKSGLVKIEDFDTTVLLFAEEYKVPLLPPKFAAVSGTFFELVCPILLVLGIGTRIAALPLLVMTAVIQFTYMDHLQHYYWAMILSGLVIYGAGLWSVDSWLSQRYPALSRVLT